MSDLVIPPYQSADAVQGEHPVSIEFSSGDLLLCDEYTALALRGALDTAIADRSRGVTRPFPADLPLDGSARPAPLAAASGGHDG